jgi:hypothetical protein
MPAKDQSTSHKPTPGPDPIPVSPPAPTSSAHATGSSDSVNGPMPAELKTWNWGAFLLNWIWGIGHNVWISLLMFVPFINIFVWFYLGAKGNELAWQHRHFQNVEQFKAVQKAWMYWGIGVFVAQVILMAFFWTMIMGAFFATYVSSPGSSDNYYGQPEPYQETAPEFYTH